ncbi:hypothetical protein J6590_103656 [Homalodisca vitripennis]|nr:hypothetical protein J6590_103656 [Homalodisca vitripennis]
MNHKETMTNSPAITTLNDSVNDIVQSSSALNYNDKPDICAPCPDNDDTPLWNEALRNNDQQSSNTTTLNDSVNDIVQSSSALNYNDKPDICAPCPDNDDTPLWNEALRNNDQQSSNTTTLNDSVNDIVQSSPALSHNDKPDICAHCSDNVGVNLLNELEEECNDSSSTERDTQGRPKKGRKRRFEDQTRVIKKKKMPGVTTHAALHESATHLFRAVSPHPLAYVTHDQMRAFSNPQGYTDGSCDSSAPMPNLVHEGYFISPLSADLTTGYDIPRSATWGRARCIPEPKFHFLVNSSAECDTVLPVGMTVPERNMGEKECGGSKERGGND